MRPIRLEVQGLTAYRDKVDIDFTDLDLFAITGPTGAGKSSLVDAITYALFGQAPRVGRSVRELISQGEDKLRVTLEFSANGERYRIFRESGRKSQKVPQLERFDPAVNGWRPEEVERVKDTNEFIERLLRMDYEAFIRSVLLPQGEFQEFLAGDRDQRRRVLDGLLQLGVYSRMGQMANAIAARSTDRADEISRRLESELADATPEVLKATKLALKQLEAEMKGLSGAREALESAARTVDTLAESLDKARSAAERKTEAKKKLAEVKDASSSSRKQLEDMQTVLTRLQEKLDKVEYDDDEFLRYRDASGNARELENALRELKEAEEQWASLESQLKVSESRTEAAVKTDEAASAKAEDAAKALDEAKRTYVAVGLRQRLKPGDECPVCRQTVTEVPHEPQPELEKARETEAQAKRDSEEARKKRDEADRTLTQLRTRLETFTTSRTQAAKKAETRRKALVDALGGKEASQGEIDAALKRLESARTERDGLTRELTKTTQAMNELNAKLANANAEVARLSAIAESAEREAKEAGDAAEMASKVLRAAAQEAEWTDVMEALQGSGNAPRALRARLTQAQERERVLNQAIGAQKKQIEVITENIGRVKALREEEKSLRSEALLARDLASLLRVDAFPTFIRESALKTLARVGSERLLEISGGRYGFVVEGQDFLVEDRWNGGEKRSVKTLSGGETFLASLALALALAEQLPGLAGEAHGGPLESLFIDEGFAHLDNETLNVVASALEVLGQDRSRLIGVITHVPALAERMPARITVQKTQSGSSVAID